MKKALFILSSVIFPVLVILSGCDKKRKEPVTGSREIVFGDISSIRPDETGVDVSLPDSVINDSWSVAGGNAAHAMPPAALNKDLSEVWRVSVGTGSTSTTRLLNGPVVADGKVFTIDALGLVSAINLETGELLWQKDVLPENEAAQPFGGGIAYDSGVVFAASAAAEVLALDAISGEIRWRRKVTAPVRSAPLVHAGYVYVVTVNNQLEVLGVKDGEVLWNHSGTLEIAGLLGGASPALGSDVVIVPYTSGEVFALRSENGYTLWSETIGSVHPLDSVAALSHIKARPIIYRNRVILISHGGRMVSLDLRNGQGIWSKEIAGIRTPGVGGDYLFLVTTDSRLLCMRQENGHIIWVRDLPQINAREGKPERVLWAGPLLTEQGLILAGTDGRVVFSSPKNGEVLRVLDLGASVALSPVIARKTLLFLTENAELIAYR